MLHSDVIVEDGNGYNNLKQSVFCLLSDRHSSSRLSPSLSLPISSHHQLVWACDVEILTVVVFVRKPRFLIMKKSLAAISAFLPAITPPARTYRSTKPLFLDNVFSNDDLVWGISAAVGLASLASFLQGRRAQDDFVLGVVEEEDLPLDPDGQTALSNRNSTYMKETAFDGWEEMSRPDNYVWYNRPRRRKQQQQEKASMNPTIALFALLLIFGPIFSFEFFLTLSRQMFCGIGLAPEMCLPI